MASWNATIQQQNYVPSVDQTTMMTIPLPPTTHAQSQSDRAPEPWSKETHDTVCLVLRGGVTGVVSIFGLVSNTINIIVFYRQGILSHSSMVSFTALAVSDFILCLLNAWASVCAVILYGGLYTPYWKWNVYHVYFFTALRPINYATSVTCYITAFASFERLISVMFPFKVKVIFTPKRSLVIIMCLYVLNFYFEITNMFDYLPAMRYDTEYNITKLMYVRGPKWPRFYAMLPNIARITLRVTSIAMVAVANIIIFRQVRVSQKFRNQATKPVHQSQSKTAAAAAPISSEHTTATTTGITAQQAGTDQSTITTTKQQSHLSKELRLLRMVSTVATVFFVCYIIDIPAVITFSVVLRFSIDYHRYLDELIYFVNFFLQCLNSSVNIIIYFTMSSAFRQEFQNLFGFKQNGKQT